VRLIFTTSDVGQTIEDLWFCKKPRGTDLCLVRVPPLRERRSDIPLLVWHSAKKWARWTNKSIDGIPTETMEPLVSYGWPNNVRELEDVIARSVSLAEGPELRFALSRP
jgi:transcriptional regulator with GAF, ATPase, and Fis domain